MNFAFSPEQEVFRDEIRRFVAQRWPIAEVRRLMETQEGFDRAVWKQMAQELGLQGVAIPEAHGGQGFGFVELGIALEELGRELAGGPFLATTCLAVPVLQQLATQAQRDEWLAPIAAGELCATLAVEEAAPTTATRDADGWRLNGAKRFVIDAQNADLILVAARADTELGLFAVRGDAPGLDAVALDGLDPTRKQADLRLEGVGAVRLGGNRGEGGDARAALARTLDVAAVALAAEGIGAAARCLEASVAYAKQRMQFARPIGAFQAIKHKAAEVLLELELGRSVAYWSWCAVDGEEIELSEAASVAKSVIGDAFMRAATENIQIHGGMGYTWENDAHLYYKRARSADVFFGTPSAHRLRLADRLGFPAR